MLVFPSMLISVAERVGMAVPPKDFDEDNLELIKEDFPHFVVFCNIQLCRRMHPNEHWENAEAIVKIPVEELKTMLLGDYLKYGVQL